MGPRLRRLTARPLVRVVAVSVLLLVVFYVVPVEAGVHGWRLVARVLTSLLGVVAAAWLTIRQLGRQLGATGEDEPPLVGLAIALVASLVAFALADYVLAISKPGEFVGLQTRTDAIYFALATLLTVGYGDVHAQSQAARLLVSAQMVINIAVLATGASLLVNQATARIRRARGR
jgi:voltage-gated potassium channel